MYLGLLGQAMLFYERAVASAAAAKDWLNASHGYMDLTELHAYLGALTASVDASRQALALACRVENKPDERTSLAYQAWTAHLRGRLETAAAAFAQAEALERERDSSNRYLYSLRGIQHADHLRRTGDADYARRVTDANLVICQRNRWPSDVSMCHRIFGDLAAQTSIVSQISEVYARARQHHDKALKIARSISHRPSLIEALLARQSTLAKVSEPSQGLGSAFDDLNEALGYALAGGYRIYEADIRIGLA